MIPRRRIRQPMAGVRICAACAVALGGCTATNPVADPTTPKASPGHAGQLRTFYYECEDKSSMVVQYDPTVDEMVVFLPDKTVRLPHVRSGSGARYSNGEITYWNKGREALLQIGSVTTRCVENRRRSVIEDAKLRSVDYWATGNEPGWRLELDARNLRFITNYGQDRYSFVAPKPQVDRANRRTLYKSEGNGSTIMVQIDGKTCRDSMSGEGFESTVIVTLNDKTYHGCGLALH